MAGELKPATAELIRELRRKLVQQERQARRPRRRPLIKDGIVMPKESAK